MMFFPLNGWSWLLPVHQTTKIVGQRPVSDLHRALGHAWGAARQSATGGVINFSNRAEWQRNTSNNSSKAQASPGEDRRVSNDKK